MSSPFVFGQPASLITPYFAEDALRNNPAAAANVMVASFTAVNVTM